MKHLACVLIKTFILLTWSVLHADEAPTADDGTNPQAVVNIDVDAPVVRYDRWIFGGFLEHFDGQVYGGVFDPGSPLADERGLRRDVVAAPKELRTSIVRWPGGCFVSGYHWELGVGKDRQPTGDMAWGVIEPNTFGTDEYVGCRSASAALANNHQSGGETLVR